MGFILYLLAGLLALAYFWIKKRFAFWSDRGFASPKPTFPFGSLKGVGTKVTSAEAIDVYYKKYKGKVPVVGIYFFLSPTVLPIDPELLKNIMVRDFSSFHNRGFYYNKEDDPTSANLLTLEGAEWRERRVKLSPIFTSGKMKMMFDTVDTISDRFLNVMGQQLKSSKSIEMRSLSAKYTSDVIGNVAFGLECRCLEDPNSAFLKHGRRLFDITSFELLKFIFSSGFPDLARKLHLRTNAKEPADFFLKTFLETMEYRERNNIKRNDFVSMLLGLKDSFTKEELAAEGFIVFAGGFETSSTLTQFTLYELALNTDIQERLREEIKSAADENDGKVTYDMLLGMKYLEMVFNESLRKYPPIPSTARKSVNEYKIPGTDLTIPAGTNIEIPIYSLHHDPEYYPEPSRFDPERFTPENSKDRHQFTFLPFGEGPRNCIGLRFGLMQSKIAVVKILQNYEVTPSDRTPIPMKFVPQSPFLAPVGDMWLNFKKIERNLYTNTQ